MDVKNCVYEVRPMHLVMGLIPSLFNIVAWIETNLQVLRRICQINMLLFQSNEPQACAYEMRHGFCLVSRII